jgi:hypothetical protein
MQALNSLTTVKSEILLMKPSLENVDKQADNNKTILFYKFCLLLEQLNEVFVIKYIKSTFEYIITAHVQNLSNDIYCTHNKQTVHSGLCYTSSIPDHKNTKT